MFTSAGSERSSKESMITSPRAERTTRRVRSTRPTRTMRSKRITVGLKALSPTESSASRMAHSASVSSTIEKSKTFHASRK